MYRYGTLIYDFSFGTYVCINTTYPLVVFVQYGMART